MAADRRTGPGVQVIGAPPTPPESGPPSRGGLMVTLMGLGLLAAFVVGVLAGQSAERQAETASPTLPPGRLDPEMVLSWQAGPSLEVGDSVMLVQLHGSYFLFGRSDDPGLRAYRSDDGQEWEDLGLVISGADVSIVVASGDRLLAAGAFYPEVRTDGHSTPAVWISDDGTSWQRSDLPFQAEPGFDYHAYVQAAGLTGDRAVVFGRVAPDVDAKIRSVLSDEIAELADEFGMSWYGEPPSVFVHGPFGFPVFTATLEDLGLDPKALPSRGWEPLTMWTSSGLRSWDDMEAPGRWANADFVLTAPDGRLIAGGCCGRSLWISADGVDWRSVSVPGGFLQVAVFDDLLLASRANAYGPGRLHARYRNPALMASLDMESWDYITPDELLAPANRDWALGSLSTGGYGIAVLATYPGFDPSSMPPPLDAVVAFTEGDVTLSYYPSRGAVGVTRGEETLLELSTYPTLLPDQVRVDLEDRTVSFLDPESRDVLITLAFDSITSAQREIEQYAPGAFEPPTRDTSIIFSPDGENWSIQSAARAFGPGVDFDQVFVLDDAVLALARPVEGTSSSSQVWIGTLP